MGSPTMHQIRGDGPWGAKVPMQRLRKAVHPDYGNRLQLEEDTDLGMGDEGISSRPNRAWSCTAAHRRWAEDHPRRRELAFAPDREAQVLQGGPSDGRDQRAPGRQEPDGHHQRGSPLPEEVHGAAWQLQKGRPAGLDEPVLVRLHLLREEGSGRQQIP